MGTSQVGRYFSI